MGVPANVSPSLPEGSTLGKWAVLQKIGNGGYGEIYLCKHPNGEKVALKLEPKVKRSVGLHKEITSLRRLQLCPRVAKYIASGIHEDYRYLVMQLLGPDLHRMRQTRPGRCFGVKMAAVLGIQMLDAVQDIHEAGFIHCDIKPSNFAVELSSEEDPYVFIIDFGHASQHLLPSGQPKPKNSLAPFRGTVRYASPHLHLRKDPGRRDDMWSLLFSLVELAMGKLPWPKSKVAEQTRRFVLAVMKSNPGLVVQGLPNQFELFLRHLVALRYEDTPDYDYLRELLMDVVGTTSCESESETETETVF